MSVKSLLFGQQQFAGGCELQSIDFAGVVDTKLSRTAKQRFRFHFRRWTHRHWLAWRLGFRHPWNSINSCV
jgi:hypothetical protein